MAITEAYTLLTEAFKQTLVFSVDWFISAALIIIILFVITRDKNKWKLLAFPVTVFIHVAFGITPSIIWYIITALVFVIEALSLDVTGNIFKTAEKKEVKRIYEEEKRRKQRKDFRTLFNTGDPKMFKPKTEIDKLKDLIRRTK